MNWYEIVLLVLGIALGVVVAGWLLLSIYVYNRMLTKSKTLITVESLDEKSHWWPYKERLQKSVDYYKTVQSTEVEYTVTNHRGNVLRGWLIQNEAQSKAEVPTVVLYAHGYDSAHQVDVAFTNGWMFKENLDVFLIDHEGHGRSEGKHIGFGIRDCENIPLWVDKINEIYNHKVRILLQGVSMGGNTMLMTADKPMENVVGIIADCAYKNAYNEFVIFTQNKLIADCMRLFLLIVWKKDVKKITTEDALKKSLYPVLFIHGDSDTLVPTQDSRDNFEACTSRKDILIVPGAAHALSSILAPDEYSAKIKAFIKTL